MISSNFLRVTFHSGISGKVGILRCLPDLAGRLARAGRLSPESTMEQKSAGLNKMTPEEQNMLNHYNEMYVAVALLLQKS